MRLSEAIWLGSKLKKQTFGFISRVIHFRDKRVEIRTCALGAALDAFGMLPAKGTSSLDPCFPDIIHPVVRLATICPVCEAGHNLASQIAHLNDTHRWARERIADWVATIEARHPELPGAVVGTPEQVEEVATVRESRLETVIGAWRGLVAR